MTLTCPYCREEVNPSNQILCDACQTPHHYDCWKENCGCTVFGCAQGPKDEEKITVLMNDLNDSNEKKYFLNSNDVQTGPFSQYEITKLLQEGKLNDSAFVWGPEMKEWSTLEKMSYKFNSMQSEYSKSQGIKNSEVDLIKIFVKNNYFYYQRKWMDQQKIGYNYAGFFVNTWWLAYRKMYAKWAIATLIYLVFSWIPISGLVISYFLGKNANGWYLSHCRAKVQEICPDGFLDDFRKRELENQGGGSWIAAIGLNLISITAAVIIYALIHAT
jgi:hypothetical protein